MTTGLISAVAYDTGKRMVDVLFSAVALAALSPLFGTVALAIRIDSPGPVFFRQTRLGRYGRPFRIVKFRTMVAEAGVVVGNDMAASNPRDDSRLTRVGRFLRRTSLDELPQLLNVLAGDMSLVGPRPDLPDALQYYTDAERDRLLVRPGITGLAQVSGRNELPPREKWRLDAQYARNVTAAGDLRILLRTVRTVFSGRGVARSTKKGA